ncbi:cobyrinate a,c-diamide synthase [Neomoorella thermoacetica]|uniref:Cobyrinate a,c-diamide synthase n=1 Tax=Neomoorella thermoacetica TaxID=1525 RepID=A0A1J5JHZ4_NEOTH|nr:cobyrinate a,c-diamide synthase [Moorella thermoacetica]OIQ08444.1 cobyrinic acid A,C-diamide synthase [Moorella thermoacetica]OIQ59622.1 cobyrinic acid A,C-diamide synthase [Moorella thermoacetica]
MRLVIAAPHGRSGKTTITIGLIAALRQKGLVIQPFKKGPDFIDPGWLSLVAGRPCRNLDLYFLSPEKLRLHFAASCRGADVGLVEGAMGLFDGLDLEGSDSTAAVARALMAPVVLVIDATRMTRSAAALVRGFQNFDPGVSIAGVILNQVARARHEDILRRSIEHYTGLPVLGALPKKKDFGIPDRHLGLIPAAENERLHVALEATGKAIAAAVDLDALLAIASRAPELTAPEQENRPAPRRVRLGVFQDRVFTFYYPENLEALAAAGAELVKIDSLADEKLPDVQGLYLGGGFPEVFAPQLEANRSLRREVREAVAAGMPVYAECGGLMYLARRLNYRGRWYEMCGALPLDVTMSSCPQGHGYTAMYVEGDSPFLTRGSTIRGHEFHHSRVINLERREVNFLYRVRRGYGIDGQVDGILYRQVLAGYNHLYAPSSPEWAPNLVALAAGN